MVEVPAAALAADEICAVADFVSVGSNDLTSYTMAADRTEPGVADLLDPSATAVQRLLDQLCDQARAAGTSRWRSAARWPGCPIRSGVWSIEGCGSCRWRRPRSRRSRHCCGTPTESGSDGQAAG